ncbi:hypothetical protein BH09BAC1_BH09BAC1_23830 [soil metagenome]
MLGLFHNPFNKFLNIVDIKYFWLYNKAKHKLC